MDGGWKKIMKLGNLFLLSCFKILTQFGAKNIVRKERSLHCSVYKTALNTFLPFTASTNLSATLFSLLSPPQKYCVDSPLNETRVFHASTTHKLEHPPRIVGLKRVLHWCALIKGYGKGGIPAAVRHCHYAILVGGHGGHNAPVEPVWLATIVAGVDIALSVWEVFLQWGEYREVIWLCIYFELWHA